MPHKAFNVGFVSKAGPRATVLPGSGSQTRACELVLRLEYGRLALADRQSTVNLAAHVRQELTSYTLMRLAKEHLQVSTYCDSTHKSRKGIVILMQRKNFT